MSLEAALKTEHTTCDGSKENTNRYCPHVFQKNAVTCDHLQGNVYCHNNEPVVADIILYKINTRYKL